jgi:hypothetical protein
MRRLVGLSLMCAGLASCSAQRAQPPQDNAGQDTMEVFDQRRFDEHKTAGHYRYVLPDGSEIEQWESPGESYLEVTRKGLTNYSTYRMFYYSNKHLMKKGEQFFRFPIGIWRSYSETLAITEEVDHDKAFRISIADLDRIMKEFKVDIMRRGNGVGVLREESPKPVYIVTFQDVPGDDSAIRFVEVDGVTGKILSQMVKRRTKD